MGITHLIPSLEPKLRALYDDHIERAARIDWSYHEYLPLDALRADPESIPRLSPAILLAVETALLTEVNLPWFTAHIYSVFKGSLAVMLDFLHTWTAEEDQHALLLETYLMLGRNGDTAQRMALRRAVIRQGWAANIETHFGTIAYTAIQELATQTFYLRVADAAESEDPRLSRALRRLAKDETLHMAFYRDAVKAHLEVEPNYVYPLAELMIGFEWPGVGMPNFVERMEALSLNIDYGPPEYYSQVIDVLWRYWDVEHLAPSLAEAREALARVNRYHQKLARVATRIKNQRNVRLNQIDS